MGHQRNNMTKAVQRNNQDHKRLSQEARANTLMTQTNTNNTSNTKEANLQVGCQRLTELALSALTQIANLPPNEKRDIKSGGRRGNNHNREKRKRKYQRNSETHQYGHDGVCSPAHQNKPTAIENQQRQTSNKSQQTTTTDGPNVTTTEHDWNTAHSNRTTKRG